jgi:hypothetical protein
MFAIENTELVILIAKSVSFPGTYTIRNTPALLFTEDVSITRTPRRRSRADVQRAVVEFPAP